jgi:hypothetical protein
MTAWHCGSLFRFVLVLAATPGALGLVLVYTAGLSGEGDTRSRTGFSCVALGTPHDCYDTNDSRNAVLSSRRVAVT